MDFLDPRKKRSYHIRLMVGYFLIAVAIGLGATILVYGAYGYSINTKTGQIIQNGLLFVDSQPGGASVYLNGTAQHTTTSARLVLPAGNYALKLTKSGYRDWQRNINLEEHTIDRYVYPFLFPVKPVVTQLKSYTAAPSLITETPDRHWLLVEPPDSGSKNISFEEYDITATPVKAPQSIDLPDDLLTNADLPGSSLKMVEWSTDNDHVLLQHTYQGGSEYIVFDRTDPSSSFNVNKVLNTDPSQVALFNKKVDQLYIYDDQSKTLKLGDTGKGTLQPVLSHVLAFKAYGTSLLTYVTDDNMPDGQAQARIWDNGKTYPLYNMNAGTTYLIDAAQYSGHWYYIAGSNTTERVNVYEDPLSSLQNASVGKAIPLFDFDDLGATTVGFSANTRFVAAEAGQQFGVYDFETQTKYQYTLPTPVTSPLQWMDGHRWLGESDGKVFAMDYDSTNSQTLVPTIDPNGGYFNSAYTQLFVLEPATDNSATVTLQDVDMRAGVDLPKNLQNSQ